MAQVLSELDVRPRRLGLIRRAANFKLKPGRWTECVAGIAGGVVSTVALHPLELVRIRFQVHEGAVASSYGRPHYHSIFNALVTIRTNQGFRGLYQGLIPSAWGAGAYWGLTFLFYNAIKSCLSTDGSATLTPCQHMLAASQATALTLTLTHPLMVAKTRLCLQYGPPAKHGRHINHKYLTTVHNTCSTGCLKKIYQVEGIRGLFRGLVPAMFGVVHGALYFMTYEEMKKLYNTYRDLPVDTGFSSLEYICFAGLSKTFSASVTYPYQAVKSRLQDQHREYGGVLDVVRRTWKFEGLRGFFKGLSPYLLHQTPSICIVFLVYETIVNYTNKPPT